MKRAYFIFYLFIFYFIYSPLSSSLWGVKPPHAKEINVGILKQEKVINKGVGRAGRGVNWYHFKLNYPVEIRVELFFNPQIGNLELYLYDGINKIHIDRSRYDPRWQFTLFKTSAQEAILQKLLPGDYYIKVQEIEKRSNSYDLQLTAIPVAGIPSTMTKPKPSKPISLSSSGLQKKGLVSLLLDGEYPKVKLYLATGGFDLEEKSDIGENTPLQLAIMAEEKSVVDLLLSKGANINAVNKSGATSLHIAVEKGNSSIVESLLDYGALTHLRNIRGETPLEIAEKLQYSSIIHLLQNISSEPQMLKLTATKRRNELFSLGFSENEIKEILKKEGLL